MDLGEPDRAGGTVGRSCDRNEEDREVWESDRDIGCGSWHDGGAYDREFHGVFHDICVGRRKHDGESGSADYHP